LRLPGPHCAGVVCRGAPSRCTSWWRPTPGAQSGEWAREGFVYAAIHWSLWSATRWRKSGVHGGSLGPGKVAASTLGSSVIRSQGRRASLVQTIINNSQGLEAKTFVAFRNIHHSLQRRVTPPCVAEGLLRRTGHASKGYVFDRVPSRFEAVKALVYLVKSVASFQSRSLVTLPRRHECEPEPWPQVPRERGQDGERQVLAGCRVPTWTGRSCSTRDLFPKEA
jgi:hypothetical protein